MAAKGERPLTIEEKADKRSITGTFASSFDGNFLPVQIIYGGKTTQSLQRFVSLKDFNPSKNPKHFSDTAESLKFLKEVVKPYVIKQKQILKCCADQEALAIVDAFTDQVTTAVLDAFKEANVSIVSVPANMTKFHQPLDLTVHGFLKRKFNEWYSAT